MGFHDAISDTRDGNHNLFAAQQELCPAVLGRACLQPICKQFVAQIGFVRRDGFGDAGRGGIADCDAIGNVEVHRFALILDQPVEVAGIEGLTLKVKPKN